MPFHLITTVLGGLPPLAWVAAVDLDRERVRAWVGKDVETASNWLVEGVWSGPFERGEFAAAEHFFGSGLSIRDDEVWLVPSSSTVDRILVCESDGFVLASNCLALLLAFIGGRLLKDHDYTPQSYAQNRDLRHYSRDYPIDHPRIDKMLQIFQERVIISRDGLSFKNPHEPRDFGSFWEYTAALLDEILTIDQNIRSAQRHHRLAKFATISTGYDSPAVAVLLRDVGIEACFSIERSNSGIPRFLDERAAVDDGSGIAEKLGLNVVSLPEPSGETVDEDEIAFLAASAAPAELAFYHMHRFFANIPETGVVFTGHHGGSIWGGRLQNLDGTVTVKGDMAGLNLTEARLHGGFIHVPVPGLYLWSAEAVTRIESSSEMDDWRVEGSYDRPIPRRIVEEAGIPRDWFGYRKKAVVQAVSLPNNPQLRENFLSFLENERSISRRKVRLLLLKTRIRKVLHRVYERMPIDFAPSGRSSTDRGFDYWLFEWAVGAATMEMEEVLGDTGREFRA